MTILGSVRAVARTGTTGSGTIDWQAAAEAARASTPPGDLRVDERKRRVYAADVRAARCCVAEAVDVDVHLPRTIEIQNRHHWIAANVESFERILAPLDVRRVTVASAARVVNTGTMAVMLSVLGRSVLGQYDPVLRAEDDEHDLSFVHPNIEQTAQTLGVDTDRFRRWIAFHEVTHAAEFAMAPWLSSHLEDNVEAAVAALADGRLDRDSFENLDATMTVVEGYAEFLMDRVFDTDPSDLRDRLEARRRNYGPVRSVIERLLGIGVKRRQYDRGVAFFEAVADARGLPATTVTWRSPETLPHPKEIERPSLWIRRIDP